MKLLLPLLALLIPGGEGRPAPAQNPQSVAARLVGTWRLRYIALVGSRLVLRPTRLPAGLQEWTVEFERVTK
jgi:hypothetical protein